MWPTFSPPLLIPFACWVQCCSNLGIFQKCLCIFLQVQNDSHHQQSPRDKFKWAITVTVWIQRLHLVKTSSKKPLGEEGTVKLFILHPICSSFIVNVSSKHKEQFCMHCPFSLWIISSRCRTLLLISQSIIDKSMVFWIFYYLKKNRCLAEISCKGKSYPTFSAQHNIASGFHCPLRAHYFGSTNHTIRNNLFQLYLSNKGTITHDAFFNFYNTLTVVCYTWCMPAESRNFTDRLPLS